VDLAGKEEEIVAWVRLDDAMPNHPKVMAAGPQGFALDVAGICYSNKHSTDGFIPDYALPAVCPSLSSPRKWARRLVEVGRWVAVDGGWRIHDIEDFQFTRAEMEDRETAKSEKAAKANHVRWHKQRGVVDPNCSLCDPRTIPGRSPDDPRTNHPVSPVPSRPVRDISSTDGLRAFNDQRARDEAKSERDAGGSIRSVHAVATWKAAQTDFAAESARLWAHRDCPTCGGKGHTEEYAPGAGNVKTPCTEVVE
jgi:hypothetical protein